MNNGDQYDIQEDLCYAHIVNRHGKGMTATAMVPLVLAKLQSANIVTKRTPNAAALHVSFIRRLLAGKCLKYPAKYTDTVIAQLKYA
ncbi:hypothetical protein HP548_22840 [Paenibacillus taichungensis]|uniref:Uncharacterized protein n=1 Tax=Paenibacillus taichungensis TaxID=484184 RepID=A0ABX2MSA4_9BACL|nr:MULTISPECIES: hypothetical protein [Paenibacillus]NUU56923.1 hypothetical protein [Paenibacillus taichungensis]PIH60245.1 hypothetical protein CS562_03825 [Paenibacillus sp. LK1]